MMEAQTILNKSIRKGVKDFEEVLPVIWVREIHKAAYAYRYEEYSGFYEEDELLFNYYYGLEAAFEVFYNLQKF